MGNSNDQLSVKDILEKAFGKELVNDETFKIDPESENIYYSRIGITTGKDRKDYFTFSGNNFKLIQEHYTRKDKSFVFFYIKEKPEYLFSLEIIDLPDNNRTYSLLKKESLENLPSKEDIVRFNDYKNFYIVAIKIGPKENRDYTALRHYVVSSDNRTYNKVVRNMIEYVTVNYSEPLPENKTELAHNLLVSGAPGTGKSHYLDKEVKKAGGLVFDKGEVKIKEKSFIDKIVTELAKLGKANEGNENIDINETAIKEYCDNYVTRVTFYEDYSYENFVGCYKPVPAESTTNVDFGGKNGTLTENKITYKFVSGPFIDTYVKAKNDSEHNYFLIIEEINRAKAASVFGDMFQLLDRKNGISEYEIKPDSALDKYLKQELKENFNGSLRLPRNMYIWATMNSADQGVMPLDSAFKRRWAQIYMDINSGSNDQYILSLPTKTKEGGNRRIRWDKFRLKINEVILANGFDEDRCIGSWYFKPEEFTQIETYFEKGETERDNLTNPLIDKLFYYLRQDVFRRNPGLMFKNETQEKPGISMSDLRRRVRQGHSIEDILNIGKLEWEEENSEEIGSEGSASPSIGEEVSNN